MRGGDRLEKNEAEKGWFPDADRTACVFVFLGNCGIAQSVPGMVQHGAIDDERFYGVL